jgi:hypothetical protein
MRFQRRSDKHGPRYDDALKHDTELGERNGAERRPEEWDEEGTARAFRPDADLAPEGEMVGGTPAGVNERDVLGRSEIARWLRPGVFPATAERLAATVTEMGAADDVCDLMSRLPSDRVYRNVQDVWHGLGGGMEDSGHRA